MPYTLEEIQQRYEAATSVGDNDVIQDCITQSRALGTTDGQTFASLLEAIVAANQFRNEEAVEIFDKIEPFYRNQQDSHHLAILLNSRGLALINTNDVAGGLATLTEALDHAKSSGFSRIEGAALSNIGMAHSIRGEIPDSIEFYHRALQMHQKNNHEAYAANTLQMLGAMYYLVGVEDRAESYLQQALETRLKTKDITGLIGAYSNLAYMNIQGRNPKQALSYINMGIALVNGEEYSDKDVNLFANAIHTYAENEMWQELRDTISKCDKRFHNDVEWIASREYGYARDCIQRSEPERAIQHLEKALEAADIHRLPDFIVHCHELLRDLAKSKGDFDGYIRHNDAAHQGREKIQGAETARKVAYIEHQRDVAEERKEAEKQKAILYSTLPKHVADRMVRGEDVTDHFDDASVLFLDIVGFTTISDKVPPGHVVHLLKTIFKVCDAACRKFGLTKIKTIGDSYLAASGVPEQLDDHADRAARAAIAMMSNLESMQLTMDPELGDTSWTKQIPEINVRIGLHSGPVVAGVVGDEQLQYDIWGDTVNTASRMESSGETKNIQASAEFVARLTSDQILAVSRGSVEVKGKGAMETYWITGR